MPLRLPSRSELELLGLVVIAGLLALYLNERGKVATRDAIIAARPAVDERREVKEEKGPTVTTRKYGPPPAPTPACPRPGPVLLEETVSQGPSKREESFARQETPLGLPAPRYDRFVGVIFDPTMPGTQGNPLAPLRIRGVRAGITIRRRVDAAASLRSHDHLGWSRPWTEADLAWRF
jgi:hypothetical protein